MPDTMRVIASLVSIRNCSNLRGKFARLYDPARFHIYPDERKTRHAPDDLRVILNRHVHKSQPQRDWPYRRVQFRNSKNTPVLQLVDILTGALAFELNQHNRAENASPAKCDLCQHILDRADVRDVFRDTAVAGKFTIWHRRLR